MNPYKKLSPFKWFVIQNFPFIEEDFDAITEYQLLCKVVEYLNKTIDKTNELGVKVEELNNWFNNLDVQEEIDNKLNEMVEDGTLAEIINEEIFESLNTRIENIENTINIYPYFDIQKNGGDSTGVTPCDTIFSTAKTNGMRKFYFAQNETNTAVYLFTNKPNFNNCEILTDNGVIISIPNSEFYSNSNAGIYKNNITLYDRTLEKTFVLPSNEFNYYNKINTSNSFLATKPADNNGLSHYNYYKYNVTTRHFEVGDITDFFTNEDYQMKHIDTEEFYICTVPVRGIGQVIETEIIPASGSQAKPCFGCVKENGTDGFYVAPSSSTEARIWYAYGTDYDTYLDSMNILSHNSMYYYDWSKPYRLKLKVLDENKIVAFYNDVPYCIIPYDNDKKHIGFGIYQPHIGDSMLYFADYFQELTPLNFNTKILILGDSRLVGGDTSLNISTLLKNNLLLNGGFSDVEIVNESVGGYTSQDVLTKLQTLDLTDYDFVVTNVGINNTNSILTNATVGFNLMSYIISQNAIPIMLLPNVTSRTTTQGANMQDKFNNIYSANLFGYLLKGEDKKYKLSAVIPNCYGNATTENPYENISNDGVHPNNFGIIQYSFNIANAILNILKS